MGHNISIILSNRQDHIDELENYPDLEIKILPQNFFCVPLDDELCDDLEIEPDFEFDTSQTMFLAGNLFALLKDLSQKGPVVYLETDYQGGIGCESALILDKGEFVYGPKISHLGPVDEVIETSPVNQALKKYGVESLNGESEFDAIDLNTYRSFDSFFEE